MKKTKRGLIIAIIVILIIIIAIGVGAYLYLTTDLFKGNQELFFKYLAKNGEIIEELTKDSIKTEMENIKQNKYTTNSEITFNLESNDPQIANQTVPAGNFNIKYSAKTDSNNNRKSSETVLRYLTTDLFTLKYIRNNDLYALKSDEVVNKYLAFDNNNLKEFATKLGIVDTSVVPDKIEAINFEELFSVTEEQKKTIIQKYLQVIYTQIPKDKYTKESNVAINVNNKNINATAYALELTQKETIDLLMKLLDTLKTDDMTLNIAIQKIQLVDKQSNITINNLKDKIQDIIDELGRIQIIEDETIKITVYVNDGRLVRTELKGGDDVISIDIEENNTSSRMILSFNTTGNRLYDTNDTNTGNNISEMEGMLHNANEFVTKQNGITVKKIELAKENVNNQNTTILVATLEAGQEVIKVSAQNKKNIYNNIQEDTIINVNIKDSTYVTAKINTIIEPANDIEVEVLTKENSATINKYTSENLSNLLQQIANRLQTLFMQKLELVTITQQQNNINSEQTITNQTSNEGQNAIQEDSTANENTNAIIDNTTNNITNNTII